MKSLREILDMVEAEKTEKKKIEFLRDYHCQALEDLLRFSLDPNIKWLLPEGAVPYTPLTNVESAPNILRASVRKLYLFVEGGNANLKQGKREGLFIEMLQTLDQKDAELLVAIKDKKLPYPSITAKLLRKAYPDIPGNF